MFENIHAFLLCTIPVRGAGCIAGMERTNPARNVAVPVRGVGCIQRNKYNDPGYDWELPSP